MGDDKGKIKKIGWIGEDGRLYNWEFDWNIVDGQDPYGGWTLEELKAMAIEHGNSETWEDHCRRDGERGRIEIK